MTSTAQCQCLTEPSARGWPLIVLATALWSASCSAAVPLLLKDLLDGALHHVARDDGLLVKLLRQQVRHHLAQVIAAQRHSRAGTQRLRPSALHRREHGDQC